MALDLADLDQVVKNEIAEVLRRDSSLGAHRECGRLFGNLILQPLAKLSAVGPISIVIDALDETEGEIISHLSQRGVRNIPLLLYHGDVPDFLPIAEEHNFAGTSRSAIFASDFLLIHI